MISPKFLVAGGGLAGLTASIELALNGHTVALYEQSKSLGGRAATHSQQGFTMNVGPHGFYRAGLMKTQFDEWGIAYSGKPPLGPGDSYLVAKGQKHRFPADAAGLLRCGAFSITEKLRLGQLMAGISKMKANPGESMQQWIDRQSTSEDVRNFLAALTRLSTYSAMLRKLDGAAGLAQLQLAAKASVLYLDGGWETLIAALAAKARSLGVAIHTNSGLTAASPNQVRLRSGEQLAADGIILAVPPRAVEELTGCALPTMTAAKAACLDLCLRRWPEHAANFALGLDQPTYVSLHSAYAKRLAPAGGALVQLAMYLSPTATSTREQLEELADLVLPGWRNELVYSRFLPDMTVVHAIPAVDQPRPDVDSLGDPGLLVAGDWVGPEAMLADAAVASGLRAARRLMQTISAAGKAA